MVLQALVIALLFAEPAAAAGKPVPTPPPAAAAPAPAAAAPADAPPAPPTMEEVTARVDALLTPWKGRSGERLRGILGLSEATRTASDGEVVFWSRRAEATACAVTGGVIQCGTIGGAMCRLGVAFEKDGKVRSWKLSGDALACTIFLDEIVAPA